MIDRWYKSVQQFSLAVSAFVLLFGCGKSSEYDEQAKQSLFYGDTVPEFVATNYDGRTISKSEFLGKVWVVDFFFTSCGGPCPTMSSQLSVLQSKFADRDDFVVVSFTVDPENDTPEVLKKYAAKYGARPDKWYFLRMDKPQLLWLSEKGFKVAPPTEPGMHSTHFILVDRHGRIRGYYPGTDVENFPKLIAMVELLLQQES